MSYENLCQDAPACQWNVQTIHHMTVNEMMCAWRNLVCVLRLKYIEELTLTNFLNAEWTKTSRWYSKIGQKRTDSKIVNSLCTKLIFLDVKLAPQSYRLFRKLYARILAEPLGKCFIVNKSAQQQKTKAIHLQPSPLFPPAPFLPNRMSLIIKNWACLYACELTELRL